MEHGGVGFRRGLQAWASGLGQPQAPSPALSAERPTRNPLSTFHCTRVYYSSRLAQHRPKALLGSPLAYPSSDRCGTTRQNVAWLWNARQQSTVIFTQSRVAFVSIAPRFTIPRRLASRAIVAELSPAVPTPTGSQRPSHARPAAVDPSCRELPDDQVVEPPPRRAPLAPRLTVRRSATADLAPNRSRRLRGHTRLVAGAARPRLRILRRSLPGREHDPRSRGAATRTDCVRSTR